MKHWMISLPASTAVLAAVAITASGNDARYSNLLSWKTDRISRAFALGYTELGTSQSRSTAEVRTIGTRSCVVGNSVAFDVDDTYAFDIDEAVDVTLTYLPELTTAEALVVLFDRNGLDGRGSTEVTPQRAGALERATLRLERARFAGQGAQGTDLAVTGRRGVFALCDIELSRSGATKAAKPLGRVRLEIKDAQTERAVAARVGLYDETGRMPLPSRQAVSVRRFTDEIRRVWMNRRTFWPAASREAFYVNGTYEARVPAGRYDLVVARGPEYRVHRQAVTVEQENTTAVAVFLHRYDDLPRRGWYSGESHLHLRRDRVADGEVWAQVAAEDLHIAHLLESGRPKWSRNWSGSSAGT